MKRIIYLLVIVFVMAPFINSGFAYELPKDNSAAPYLYVFGPAGNPDDGADMADNQQIIFFDVPQTENTDLTIDIFDHSVEGNLEKQDSQDQTWDTIVKYCVYGKEDTLLGKEDFEGPDRNEAIHFRLGPYPKELGEKIGEFYRFKLVVSPLDTVILKGNEICLFNVRVSPYDVETFSDKVSLRLLPQEGAQMPFYPQVPAGVAEITVENYDMDPDGGSATLYDPMTKKTYKIADSDSGAWAQTKVDIGASSKVRRLSYIITTKTQQNGNAIIRVKDGQGNLLPIYYSDKERKILASESSTKLNIVAPVKAMPVEQLKVNNISCGTFKFDATGSYDPNDDKISYLWNFGDGATSTEPVVTHIYQKGGEYQVTLKVDDNCKTNCSGSETSLKIKVNDPPVPIIKIQPLE